jgi:HSP20 family protein
MTIDLWDEMMNLERRFDDFARSYLGPRARSSFPAAQEGLKRPFIPRTDVFVRGDDCVVHMEIPGIDVDKDVEVLVAEGELIVRGHRERRNDVKESDFSRMEVSYGSFERRFALASEVKEKDVKARYEDGILEITLPAPHVELPPPKEDWRSVPIASGNGS